VDRTFLQRHQLDVNGGLYKAVHWKFSNLRPPNITSHPHCPWAVPDWPSNSPECPEVYRKANGKPKSDFGDLWQFTTQLHRASWDDTVSRAL
jgi:hypothetical protein